jgi:hypothetical protein
MTIRQPGAEPTCDKDGEADYEDAESSKEKQVSHQLITGLGLPVK